MEAAKIGLMAKRDFERAKQRERVRSRRKTAKQPAPRAVHPNSMAARKWGRTHWT